MMRRSLVRRILSGGFLVWFAVFGLTRGILGVCPEHAGGHGSPRGVAVSGAAAVTPTVHPAVHSTAVVAHDDAADAGMSHAGMSHADMAHAGASQVASDEHAGTERETPPEHGCDCRGECCCCAAPQANRSATVVFAVDAAIAMPRGASSPADRPVARVYFAQPFATAPPAGQTA